MKNKVKYVSVSKMTKLSILSYLILFVLNFIQGQLCAQILKINNAMKNVVFTVNLRRCKILNHRQFQALQFFEEGSE